MNSQAIVRTDGSVVFVEDPALAQALGCMGIQTRTRASHILPQNKWKRAAFRALRALFGERGAVAQWTRRGGWGPWQVSWAAQPDVVVYRHHRRSKCVTWERKHLNRSLEECPR